MGIVRDLNWRKISITLLRMAIGWHLLYEGMSKLFAENWSAHSYLINTSGFMSAFYHWLASSPGLMRLVDLLNVYGLVAIGLALFLGVFVRYAAIAGVFLLALYYLAYPPLGVSWLGSGQGNLYIVNRTFIEILVLLAILFVKEKGYGLSGLAGLLGRSASEGRAGPEDGVVNSRREVLANLATLPALGVMGWGAFRESQLYGLDTLSGATIQVGGSDISELKGELPKGTIGGHTISRLIIGGNLIGGWAHSRDLIYVPSLFRAYNTEKKIFETLQLAEKAGIDTINIGFLTNPVLQKYKKITGSKIQVISQVAPERDSNDYFKEINAAIDYGADILQIQGNWSDWLVRDHRIDVIESMMEKIRGQGYTAGLGAHTVDTLIACEDEGIVPDYYMKTMHHDQYWSAHPRENRIPFEVDSGRHPDHNRFHDNIFCLFPERTVEFVKRVQVPFMGFKVLAAGAIEPEDGFRWAFENGADFICVGMFDFQVVDDVNTTIDILDDLLSRRRWLS